MKEVLSIYIRKINDHRKTPISPLVYFAIAILFGTVSSIFFAIDSHFGMPTNLYFSVGTEEAYSLTNRSKLYSWIDSLR